MRVGVPERCGLPAVASAKAGGPHPKSCLASAGRPSKIAPDASARAYGFQKTAQKSPLKPPPKSYPQSPVGVSRTPAIGNVTATLRLRSGRRLRIAARTAADVSAVPEGAAFVRRRGWR